jgi:hypothetical protein
MRAILSADKMQETWPRPFVPVLTDRTRAAKKMELAGKTKPRRRACGVRSVQH